MLREFKIITVTHKSMNVKDLNQFAIQNSDDKTILQIKLDDLKSQFNISELFYLSTCNRILYFFCSKNVVDDQFCQNFFSHINTSIQPENLKHVQCFEGADTLEHFMEVASSIDSMVVGEREILRQLREAYDSCRLMGLTGDHLRLAMRKTIETAKRVYNETRIGERPVSIVSLAIQKLLKTNLSRDARILLIGAGQTNLLVSKFLTKHEFKNVVVFNRSLAPAMSIAKAFSNEGHTLEELEGYQSGFDCLIACTGAQIPIVNTVLYNNLLQGDTSKKIIVDLGAPSDVASEVISSFDNELIEIDGLRELAAQNMDFRRNEISLAQTIIHDELNNFHSLFQQRKIEKALQHVPTKIKAVKEHAINSVFKKEIAGLDSESKDLMERMMAYMEKQCISIPMKAAIESSTDSPKGNTLDKKNQLPT